MKTVFINPERCIGCRQCEFACAVAHSHSKDPISALAEEPPPRTRIHVSPGNSYNTSFPNRCHHCDPAPCVQVCPTGAMYSNADEDLVLLKAEKCIACAMCAMVCPFDALTFHAHANGMPMRVVAIKCDGCIERVHEGLEPACVEACKVDALVFGELNELIADGRLRDSAAALAAASAQKAEAEPPTNFMHWRDWGESTSQLSEEVMQ